MWSFSGMLTSWPGSHLIMRFPCVSWIGWPKDLIKTNMYQDYLEVFQQQEREGIIEEIFLPVHEFGNYVWIPHRPVVKCDPTATTKIRPVFNCSLKTGNGMSLNEAAYSGVNLTGDMLNLLMSFRANNYILLAGHSKGIPDDSSQPGGWQKQVMFLHQGRGSSSMFSILYTDFWIHCQPVHTGMYS